MKSIFSGFFVAVVTFLIGISIPDLPQFRANSTSENLTVEAVEDTPLFDLHAETPTKILEKKDLFPLGPIYRFPKTGLYFSTRKDKAEQSEFQFELTYETHYRTRKVRGIKQEYEILIIEGSAFDQQREFGRPSIKINKDKIILKTSKVKGVEYKFEGTFTKNEYFERDFDDQIVLKGMLQKFLNGKKIFEAETEFTYAVGC
jgi:hypothetical protein